MKKEGAVKSLTPKQVRAVVMLAAGKTAAYVAEELKVSKGTVHNWKSQDDAFRNRLSFLQTEIYEEGLAELRTLVRCATTTLRNVLTNEQSPVTARIGAARTILQYASPQQNTSIGPTGLKTNVPPLEDLLLELE